VRWNPLVNDEPRPTVEAMSGEEAARELGRAGPVRALRRDPVTRASGFEEEGGGGNRGTESAESASQRAAQIQYAEVEASPRLDEDAIGRGHAR
jgi:hypothetical protein